MPFFLSLSKVFFFLLKLSVKLVHCFTAEQHHDSKGTVNTKFEPILLDDSEATVIRPRMKEANERRLRSRDKDYYFRHMMSMRCKKTGSLLELWKHLKEEWVVSNISFQCSAFAHFFLSLSLKA